MPPRMVFGRLCPHCQSLQSAHSIGNTGKITNEVFENVQKWVE